MDEFGADWAMFEELGSRVMADMYAENSPVLAFPAIRTRAFAAEGEKVTGLDKLTGLYFGLEPGSVDDDTTDEEMKEFVLECQRVYEIQDIMADGRMLSKVIWPEKKEDDDKAGTTWAVRPDMVQWIYDPGKDVGTSKEGWTEQWNGLMNSSRARWGNE